MADDKKDTEISEEVEIETEEEKMNTEDQKAEIDDTSSEDIGLEQSVNLSIKQFTALCFSSGFLFGVALTLSIVVFGGVLGNVEASTTISESEEGEDLGSLEEISEFPYDVEFGTGTETVEWSGETVELEDRPYIGSDDADVKMVSYEDYFCPFCTGFHNEEFADANNMNSAFGDIAENHIKTGEVQYYFKNFPVVGGDRPAEVSECMAEHGSSEAFWTFNHNHFENFEELSELEDIEPERYDEVMVLWAEQLDVDTAEFESCLENGDAQEVVNEHESEARSLGISSTPTNVIEGEIVEGAQAYSAFRTVIEN